LTGLPTSQDRKLQNQLNLIKGISRHDLVQVATVQGEGTFALDHDGRLLFMNDEAERLLGWDSAELEGKNFFHRVDFKMDSISSIGSTKCAAIKSVGCSHLHNGASINCKDGTRISISFISLPVFDEGKMFGKVFVFCESKSTDIDAELYRSIIESAGSIIIKLDTRGEIVFASEITRNSFGERLEQLVPASVRATLRESPGAFSYPLQTVNRVKTIDGQVRQIAWSIRSASAAKDNVAGVICIGVDVTQQDTREDTLLPDRQLAGKVFDVMADGVITADQSGVVKYLNPVAEQLTGWTLSDAKGLLLKDVFHVMDRHQRTAVSESLLSLPRDCFHQENTFTHILLRRDGWEFDIEETITPVHDRQGVIIGVAIVFRDVSDAGHKADSAYEASHDGLTGLINRSEFEANLLQALSTAKADGRQHGFCYISVTSLHAETEQAADEIIKKVASLLYKKVRDTDVLARIADNEFGVLLRNCSLENAREAAQSFCNEVNRHTFSSNHHELPVTLNVGVVPITSGCGSVADVMRIADSACYVAKDKGRNRIHLYKASDIALQLHQNELQWIHRIRRALDQDGFRLYCQSIVPLSAAGDAQHTVHHEILLRMEDERGEVIRPGLFISSAERYNMMPSIDRWVVKKALSLISEKMARKQPLGIFAINLSAQSLDDENFLGFVIDQLDKTQVPAGNICFEITESTAISNLISATRFMSILRGMGCRFALDDFGRGFSSYSYLKNLQVDYLKIDGSFVRDLANDPVDHAMVESINQIGHIMGVQTIAEFVESQDVLEKLMSLGVDHVQGYQLGKPQPMWHATQQSKAKH
jgi:diguanylate cyclase (GGDEF)-like protein/PAS domain S-box-containing protein